MLLPMPRALVNHNFDWRYVIALNETLNEKVDELSGMNEGVDG